jgi:hypothetical protein
MQIVKEFASRERLVCVAGQRKLGGQTMDFPGIPGGSSGSLKSE